MFKLINEFGMRKMFVILIVLNLLESFLISNTQLMVKFTITDSTVKNVCIFIGFILISITVLNIRRIVQDRYDVKMINDTRYKLLEKVIHNDYSTFISSNNGELYNIITQPFTRIGTKIIINILDIIIDLSVSLFIIYTVNTKLLYTILCIFPLFIYMAYKNNKVFNETSKEFKKCKCETLSKLEKILDCFCLIKINNTEKNELNEFTKICDKWTDATYKRTRAVLNNNNIFKICLYLGITISIIYKMIYNIDAIDLLLITSYITRTFDNVFCMIDLQDDISEYKVLLNKYNEIMSIKNDIIEGDINMAHFDSTIKFNNVSFKYNDSDSVLKDINLEIKKGEKIGIVGPSGAGKSSLIYLLNRFYDVSSGWIEIDDIDIRELNNKSLRNIISYVSQNTDVFNDTILNNIVYGINNKSKEDIIEACKKANIHDFIMNLPNGYDTVVGNNGLKLSGGQRQRICIARAFLKNSPILILDEATSALDNESEKLIKESLKELEKNKTVISIAHRLSTISDYDKIVVLDNHKIKEIGNHNELIKLNGLYSKLYNISLSK